MFGSLEKKWKWIIIIGSVLSAIFGAYNNWQTLIGLFKSDHDTFIESNYINALIVPFSMKEKTVIHFGKTGRFEFSIPEEGIDLTKTMFLGCVNPVPNSGPLMDDGFLFKLRIKDDIFKLSIIIKDLKTGSVITEIQDNEIKVNKTGVYDFDNKNSRRLEIKDQYGNIAFCMWINDNQELELRGYFYGYYCTVFLNDNPLDFLPHDDPQYVQKAEIKAKQLKPMFLNTDN